MATISSIGQTPGVSPALLEVQNARVEFAQQGGSVRALDGVSLRVDPGETLAVVGESGCGKTTLARAVLGLQPLTEGEISLKGKPVKGTPRNLAEQVGMVWQDPYASLNPKWKVGRSVQEPGNIVGRRSNPTEVFEEVGLDPQMLSRYPHQLSGGQRQRVAIGRALALKPPLVICDEPTAALDLSIRAQILNLLKDIQQKNRCSFLYISHDLTTVRFLADRVAVMYLGRIVEEGPTEKLFSDPRHPYTKALLDSAPSLEKLMQLPEPPVGRFPIPELVSRVAALPRVAQTASLSARITTQPLLAKGTGFSSAISRSNRRGKRSPKSPCPASRVRLNQTSHTPEAETPKCPFAVQEQAKNGGRFAVVDTEVELLSAVISHHPPHRISTAAGTKVVLERGVFHVYDLSVPRQAQAEVGVFAVQKVPLVERFEISSGHEASAHHLSRLGGARQLNQTSSVPVGGEQGRPGK